jgi:hypothetical protein
MPGAWPTQEAGRSHHGLFVVAASPGTLGFRLRQSRQKVRLKRAVSLQRLIYCSCAPPASPRRPDAGQSIQRCRCSSAPLQVYVECSPTGATWY